MKKILFITSAILILSNITSAVYADNYSEAQSYIKRAKTASIEEQSYDYLNKARKLLEEDYETDQTNIKLLMSLSEVFQLIGDRREAKLFILPMQDLLLKGGDYRINEPGVVREQNWAIRFSKEDFTEKEVNLLLSLNQKFNRN